MFWAVLFSLLIGVCERCVWGWAVNKVIENKGYYENWFWWGFFFGLLALIVALTKPERHNIYGDDALGENYVFKGFGKEGLESQEKDNGQPKMLSCAACGKQIDADSQFCRYCGAKAGA